MGSLSTPASPSAATLVAVTDYDSIANVQEGTTGTLFTFPLPLALLPNGAYVDFEGMFIYPLVTADAGGSTFSIDCNGNLADLSAVQDMQVSYFRVRLSGVILQGTSSLALSIESLRTVATTPGDAATPLASSLDAAVLAPTFSVNFEVFGIGVAPATLEILGSRFVVWG